ncbi:MAG: hypothetical protein LBE36_00070 [Flavobacteriaceae bacterium]|jgi:hypothetical protein|nr:hypothetical protein [Flavobacteriaceae bacterium]
MKTCEINDFKIFWDMDVKNLNLKKDAFAIIKRIILKGGKEERIWMFENFDKGTIKNTISISREIPENVKQIYLMALKNAGN